MSARMMAILGEMAAGQEVYSIDESFLDVTGIGSLIPLEKFGQQMRERIRRETGLIIGVGFGPTKTLAKLANHAAKKWIQTRGVVDLSDRSRQRKLLQLTDVSDVWGIGRRISVRMNQLGITTALQLADSNVSMIRKNFDVITERTVRELNGESCLALEDAPPPKQQIVNSRSFGQNELMRLTISCVTPQADDIPQENGSAIPAGTLCYLSVPAGKTSKAFVKPVSSVVKKYVDIWLSERPQEQAALTDERTGEKVRYLFQNRGKPVGRNIVNLTVIPLLCARAGMAAEDSRGPITSHRGRASAVTALASVAGGMSLHELMQWSGHSSAQSTMHYIRIRPTQLAASFVKADRVTHMISVLIDHDPEAVSLTGPATYYDLGDSYCTNPFWSSCQHRMACIGCDFNLLKESARGLVLESKASVRRYLEEVPLTPDERAIVEQDAEKIEQALERLPLKPEG
ncbi:hypothetical protein FJW00_15015 [Pantoea anthophila]|uniref:Integrase n=1 Tax=Pantoea anthophila TaxID=470931 RepID=A0ABY2Z501_9GAMM|nr:hypothetical protein FJW00_15015 [Pantoea anthophila]